MKLNHFMNSVGKQIITTGTVLCLFTFGTVSMANAQSTSLPGTIQLKGFCNDGAGGADKGSDTGPARFLIDFSDLPKINIELTVGSGTTNLEGFAFEKSSKSSVFSAVGLSTQTAFALSGKYKSKNGQISSLSGKLIATFDASEQCIFTGKLKAK